MFRTDRAVTGCASVGACAAVLASAVLMMIPALVNGAPFVFWDTAFYYAAGDLITALDPRAAIVSLQNDPELLTRTVSSAESDRLLDRAATHLGARSVAYALFLDRATALVSMWGAAFFQCLFVAACLWAALRLVFGRAVTPWKFVILSLVLVAATPLFIYAPLLMPDILAATMIVLVAAQFVAHENAGPIGRIALAAAILVCLLVHPSHAPIAALFAAVAAGIRLLQTRRLGDAGRPTAWVFGVIASGIAVNASLDAYAEHRLGRDLQRPPLLTARVIDDGPGRIYLAAQCKSSPYEVCKFADRILAVPESAGNLMVFGLTAKDGGVFLAEEIGVAEKLNAQNLAFARDAVLASPERQIVASVSNFLRLLVSFRPVSWPGTELTFTYESYAGARGWVGMSKLLAYLPTRERCARTPSAWCGAVPLKSLRFLYYPVVGMAGLVLFAGVLRLLLRQESLSRLDSIDLFITLVCTGMLVNALVTGVVGGPFDRYQARVIWLVPALAGALLLFSRQKLDLRGALTAWRARPV